MSLDRFHQAQANPSAGYETALKEIRGGAKQSHWIWYILPQIEGLGRSSTARAYALRSLDEAGAYLKDPILGTRYEEIVGAVAEQLACGRSVEALMGGSTDAMKLASSLTLFHAASRRLGAGDGSFAALAARWDSLLQKMAEQGYPPCEFTRHHCGDGSPGA